MAGKPKVGGNRGNAGKGRPKGVPNKVNGQLKDMIMTALEEVGGIEYLKFQANENAKTFLLAKTESTVSEQSKPWEFKPGQSGNPAGRPKSSRNRLGEQFIQALQADFEVNGTKAIATVRAERPHEYLKVVASLLPKQIEVKEGAFDGIDDEQLAALVIAARSALGAVEGSGQGVGATPQPKPAKPVSPVH